MIGLILVLSFSLYKLCSLLSLVDSKILSQYKKSCLFEYWLAHLLIEKKHLKALNEHKCDPCIVFMSLHHHEEDLALKSPVFTDKDGLRLFISVRFCC